MIFKIIILVIANTVLSVLAILFLAGQFAPLFHWIADILSHFQLQYALASLVIAPAFMINKKYIQLFLCALICIAALSNIYFSYDRSKVEQTENPVHLTVVQYNRLHSNHDYDAMVAWLKNYKDDFDVVNIQEITSRSKRALAEVTEEYPYRYPELVRTYSDLYILSKHPLKDTRFIGTSTPGRFGPPGIHVKVMAPGIAEGVSVYSLHTQSPKKWWRHAVRNQQLEFMARAIAANTSDKLIFLGDWNVAPYSPYFKSMKNGADLVNDMGGLLPIPTWSADAVLPIFQIPIDHILHRKGLRLTSKERASPMGSDHYPVIAHFEMERDAPSTMIESKAQQISE
ncbi:MAG: endonuclease/exonuclease/phosphatase family protein [Micavibrio sp.]|nr:endonuclease/exonuclease/phosphatase family protein [Micavibrio sp.]